MTPFVARAGLLVAFTAMLLACSAYDRDRYRTLTDTRAASDVAIDAASADGGADVASPDAACPACAMDRVCCSGACVDRLADPDHCGTCDTRCPHTQCRAGACVNDCVAGYEDCNRNIIDGCEVHTAEDSMNCGRCGNACALAHARSSCAVNQCVIEQCDDGYADCNGIATDGCETAVASDVEHCGSCANRCAGSDHATATCVAGICGTACNGGFADCDASAPGCETSLASASNCGACGDSCPPSAAVCAVSGTTYSCASTCALGTMLCGTACVNTASDTSHCGMCDRLCPVPLNGHATCAGGGCGIACDPGFTACGVACVDTRNSVANCGACGAACGAAPEGGVVTCSAGSCAIRCAAACTLDSATRTCNCSVAPPLPLAPLSTAYVTTQQPTLRWSLQMGSDGARVAMCRDRAMTSGCQRFDATGSTGRPSSPLEAGTWFWQLRGRAGDATGSATSAVWQLVVPVRSASRDSWWGTVLDPNGDGRADLVVGAPGANGGAGGYAVFLADERGTLVTSPEMTVSGRGAQRLGTAVASLADQNGDGFGDIGIGAPTDRAGFLLNGRPGGFWMAGNFGSSAPVGDSAASAGDLDGDGIGDTLWGAPTDAENAGGLAIWYGNGSIPYVFGSEGANAFEGASVAGNGDIDCDGRGDWLTGAPGVTGDTGRLLVYLSGAGDPIRIDGPDGAGGRFGAAVAIAGDMNADGCADVIVGAPGAAGRAGRAYVFLGGPSGLATRPAVVFTGSGEANASFGTSVSWAGDVNGDGLGDVVIGAPDERAGNGAAYVYAGSSGTISPRPLFVLDPAGTSAGAFGTAVGGLGSFDGDLFDDIVVGAPRANGAGVVFVFRGGPSMSAGTTIASPFGASGGFGAAVAM